MKNEITHLMGFTESETNEILKDQRGEEMGTKKEEKRTETPWKMEVCPKTGMALLKDTNGFDIGVIDDGMNHISATFIVRAVNSHEALLDAAKRAEKFISAEFPHLKGTEFNTLGELRDAIAGTEGETSGKLFLYKDQPKFQCPCGFNGRVVDLVAPDDDTDPWECPKCHRGDWIWV